MPIYSFACQKCGHQQDHLLKLSETLIVCPSCGEATYKKQLTAATISNTQIETTPCGADKRAIKEIGCGGNCACH